MNLKEFLSLPKYARNLIIYYTLSVPFLVVWDIFSIYLFMLGLDVMGVGILLTLTGIVGIIVSFLLGIAFDKGLSVRVALILIEIFSSVSDFFYAMATRFEHLFIGNVFERIGRLFTVSYSIYEKDVYPKENLEKIYAYHFALPELALLITYPIIGYLLGFVFTSLFAMRIVFVMAGLSSIFFVFYISKFLPPAFKKIQFKEKHEFPRKIWPVISAEIMLVFSFGITTGLVIDNFVYNILGLNVFFILIIVVITSSTSLVASILSDRLGEKHRFKMLFLSLLFLLVYGISVASLEFLGLDAFLTFVLLLLFSMILGFGHTLWFIYHRSFLFRLIPDEKRGLVLGSISSLNRIFGIFAPFVAGFMASQISPLSTFYLQIILIIMSMIMYFISMKLPKINTQ